MKTGFVLQHHHGDNGSVLEGMILKDLSETRFGELEKKGLVREATAKEVKEGYTPPFVTDGGAGDAASPPTFAAHIAALEAQHVEALKASEDRAAALEQALAEALQAKAKAEPENKKAAEPANKGA